MGCISSKLLAAADLGEELLFPSSSNPAAATAGGCPNHFVSLTSTTYGALKLDRADEKAANAKAPLDPAVMTESSVPLESNSQLSDQNAASEVEEERPSEVIDALELMGDLADETPSRSPSQKKKPPKQSPSAHRSPAVRASISPAIRASISPAVRASISPAVRASMSPAMPRKWFAGKENTPLRTEPRRSDLDASRASKPFRSLDNTPWTNFVSAISRKGTPNTAGSKKSDRGSDNSRSRRSLSPLFDPELLALFEREHCEEGEQIKKMVQGKVCESRLLLQCYENKCPKGGENTVVMYTTTLRGIRKTFEDCNMVRSLIDSYGVHIVERDISMDSGYREELRILMGKKEVKVPVVFVKGRCIGGAEEIVKLEEEAMLELLLEGMPSGAKWCDGCGGLRFVMCMDCNGSCKVLDSEKMKVKCGECNENGLIHCPICC